MSRPPSSWACFGLVFGPLFLFLFFSCCRDRLALAFGDGIGVSTSFSVEGLGSISKGVYFSTVSTCGMFSVVTNLSGIGDTKVVSSTFGSSVPIPGVAGVAVKGCAWLVSASSKTSCRPLICVLGGYCLILGKRSRIFYGTQMIDWSLTCCNRSGCSILSSKFVATGLFVTRPYCCWCGIVSLTGVAMIGTCSMRSSSGLMFRKPLLSPLRIFRTSSGIRSMFKSLHISNMKFLQNGISSSSSDVSLSHCICGGSGVGVGEASLTNLSEAFGSSSYIFPFTQRIGTTCTTCSIPPTTISTSQGTSTSLTPIATVQYDRSS